MEAGAEPIAPGETLYRRVPDKKDYYGPGLPHPLAKLAFRPGKQDTTGLSLSRAKYIDPERCAHLGLGASYYVVAFPASDLLEQGIRVEPRPTLEDRGHCELPDLNSENRRGPREEEIQKSLAHNPNNRVLGPFPGRGAGDPPGAQEATS